MSIIHIQNLQIKAIATIIMLHPLLRADKTNTLSVVYNEPTKVRALPNQLQLLRQVRTLLLLLLELDEVAKRDAKP